MYSTSMPPYQPVPSHHESTQIMGRSDQNSQKPPHQWSVAFGPGNPHSQIYASARSMAPATEMRSSLRRPSMAEASAKSSIARYKTKLYGRHGRFTEMNENCEFKTSTYLYSINFFPLWKFGVSPSHVYFPNPPGKKWQCEGLARFR